MIQNHVTNLDLSKQLYEAGIVLESEYVWLQSEEPEEFAIVLRIHAIELIKFDGPRGDTGELHIMYPAPLSSELWEILKKFEKENYDQVPSWDTYHKKWYFQAGYDMGDITEWLEVDTEADARAKCLLYLKEKGLL